MTKLLKFSAILLFLASAAICVHRLNSGVVTDVELSE
jgi:hypothetical protein